MGLCENVYRRGGVYWWRRRLGLVAVGEPAYIRISLKVRHPQRARELGRLVGVEADRLRSQGMLNSSQQKALLKTFIDGQLGHFDGVMGLFAHQDAGNASIAETRAERIAGERTMAAVYAALGSRGVAAEIDEAEAAALAAQGHDSKAIDAIAERVRYFRDCLPRMTADGQIGAEGPNGLLGPGNLDFRKALGEIDAEATNANVDHARRLWLQAVSVVLNDTDRRHTPLDVSQADAIYRAMSGNAVILAPRQPPVKVQRPPASQSVAASAPAKAGVDYTISGQIASMVKTKLGVDWKFTKRGEQDVSDIAETYIFLGKILVKMIGVDDIRKLDAEHPMQLRQLLQALPKSYGKATADWELTVDEVVAKATQAGKPTGRVGTTINKYLNSLMAFVNFLEGSGISPPITEKQVKRARVKAGKQKPNTLRSAVIEDEYKVLFADEEWCGKHVIHDSTYWVPLFTRYGGGRLEEPCGLIINEIDFNRPIPSYLIQDNEMRTIKTAARRVPFHSELLRLGFREYYESIKACGYAEAFPDFRARGKRTAIGSLLNKKFVPILDRALPQARAQKKTQHSARKTLNTELRDNEIDITVRCEILGHAQQGVNASVYTDPARDGLKKKAIETIANVTAHVPKRPIRLSPLLQKSK